MPNSEYIIHGTSDENIIKILKAGYINNNPSKKDLLMLNEMDIKTKQIFTQLIYKDIHNEKYQKPRTKAAFVEWIKDKKNKNKGKTQEVKIDVFNKNALKKNNIGKQMGGGRKISRKTRTKSKSKRHMKRHTRRHKRTRRHHRRHMTGGSGCGCGSGGISTLFN